MITRDLATTALPPIIGDWSATYRDPSLMTPSERQYLSLSDALIAELYAADVVVMESPMYNLWISAGLKAWIDHVVAMVGLERISERLHPRARHRHRRSLRQDETIDVGRVRRRRHP